LRAQGREPQVYAWADCDACDSDITGTRTDNQTLQLKVPMTNI